MNKKIAFLFFSLCFLLLAGNANAQSGLVAYLPFTGNANDASGNLNNGTATNTLLVADRLGNANSAYSFDGTSSKVVVPNSASLAFPSTQDFTIDLWIRCSAPIGSYAGLVVKAMADGEAGIPWFQFVLQDGKAQFEAGNYSTGANTVVQGTSTLADNKWHRIAVVVTRSTTSAKIIVDGNIEKEAFNTLFGLSFTNTKSILIGTERNNSRFFKGDLDEVRIYGRALDVTELSTTLLAYYPFSGNANDESGNSNNGTATGTTLVPDHSGNSNKAYSFNGTSSKIVVPDSPLLAFSATQDFTIDLWIRCSPTVGSFAGLVVKAMADGEPGIPWFQFVLQDGKAQFEVGDYATGANTSIQGSTNLADNTWHRIAVVVTRSTTSAKIIVDGRVQKDSSNSLYGLSFTNNKSLLIGTERNNSRFFKGDLDEVRIYSKALDPSLITSVGNSLSPRTFHLDQNYPNPFNPSTTIEYELTKRETIEIVIYNSLGTVVRKLVSEITAAGSHRIIWDGRNNAGQLVSSGTYFCRLKAGDLVQARKMLLLK